MLRIQVHYYEDGNVQLLSKKDCNFELSVESGTYSVVFHLTNSFRRQIRGGASEKHSECRERVPIGDFGQLRQNVRHNLQSPAPTAAHDSNKN